MIKITHNKRQLRFSDQPKLPILLSGETWTEGWDISGEYAIDSEGIVWYDESSHGLSMTPVNPKILLKDIKIINESAKILEILDKCNKLTAEIIISVTNRWHINKLKPVYNKFKHIKGLGIVEEYCDCCGGTGQMERLINEII